MKINRDTPLFITKKQEFNAYKNSLRRIINRAKKYYFSTQFQKNKGDGKKHGKLYIMFCIEKLQNLRLMPYKLTINYLRIKRKWPTHLILIFPLCVTSEIDNPNNVPSHDVYLNNPTEAEFNFEQIDNMTVLHYINKLKTVS